jgi:pimeloyl-ACP methyl ester carboxylesterase
MWLEPVANAKDNFSDLSTEEGIAWAKQMPEHSTVSFGGELRYAGYKDVPIAWLFTEKDQTLTPETQQLCIENIEQTTGRKVDVHRLESGHFPFLSRPDDVAQIIRRVAGEQL